MVRRKVRPGPLEDRSAAILRVIIEEYVATAQPVGSVALVEKYALSISPATVRNIMAELETAELLNHPHTSAGRVPTDRGYRLYVESISDSVALAPVEQLMIRHQFGQVEFASEQWFRLAASTLASATHSAAIATPIKPRACRIRRVDIVATGERSASLLLVMADGPVKQVLLTLDREYAQADLDDIARQVDRVLRAKTTPEVDAVQDALQAGPGGADPLFTQAVERIDRLMHEFDSAAVEEVFSEGLLNVMQEPEFERSERLRRVFSVLQDRVYLGDLVQRLAASGDVSVFIGSENEHEEMNDVSLVVASYGRSDRAVGVVGVIGPTRMAYPHAISTVRYVRGLMNELVDHLYA
ncbi:MAG: heat-inducible transcriptional repressor HrcA [Chloroflexota bacterium]|nr:heat-inducible transcriptional repressor HrcA [Chloroflexota bacterium]